MLATRGSGRVAINSFCGSDVCHTAAGVVFCVVFAQAFVTFSIILRLNDHLYINEKVYAVLRWLAVLLNKCVGGCCCWLQ